LNYFLGLLPSFLVEYREFLCIYNGEVSIETSIGFNKAVYDLEVKEIVLGIRTFYMTAIGNLNGAKGAENRPFKSPIVDFCVNGVPAIEEVQIDRHIPDSLFVV
jgi:hypothetical protein